MNSNPEKIFDGSVLGPCCRIHRVRHSPANGAAFGIGEDAHEGASWGRSLARITVVAVT